MADTPIDIDTVVKRLDFLEQEIHQLRGLLRPKEPEGSAATPPHPYIESIPDILGGEPIIRGTRTPVRAIVEHWRFGHVVEEIIEHLPCLRSAQIFDALSYYEDHREEIDRYILLNQVPVE